MIIFFPLKWKYRNFLHTSFSFAKHWFQKLLLSLSFSGFCFQFIPTALPTFFYSPATKKPLSMSAWFDLNNWEWCPRWMKSTLISLWVQSILRFLLLLLLLLPPLLLLWLILFSSLLIHISLLSSCNRWIHGFLCVINILSILLGNICTYIVLFFCFLICDL